MSLACPGPAAPRTVLEGNRQARAQLSSDRWGQVLPPGGSFPLELLIPEFLACLWGSKLFWEARAEEEKQ